MRAVHLQNHCCNTSSTASQLTYDEGNVLPALDGLPLLQAAPLALWLKIRRPCRP